MRLVLATAALAAMTATASAETFQGVEMLPKPPQDTEFMDDGWAVGTKVGTVLAVHNNCPPGLVGPELREVVLEARDAYKGDWMFQQAYKMAWVSTEVNVRGGDERACADALLSLE
jgi:hypothetical protein